MNEGKPTKAKWWSRPRPHGTGTDTAAAADGAGEGDSGSGSGGDYELDRPAPGPAAGANGAPAVGEGDHDASGEFGADVSAAGSGDFELDAPVPASAPAGDTASDAVPSDAVPPGWTDADANLVTGTGTGNDARLLEGVAASATASPDRPKPLHAPDPYGTPPYGEPGPWAPAPPVQHPAAGTPAHGTPTHGTPTPGTPTPGTPVPQGPPAQAAAPLPQPPAAPGQPGPAGHAGPAPLTSPTPQATAAAPWQNYDPWAAPGPLQQTGAAVASTTQRRKRAKKALVLGALVLALVSGGVGGAVGAYLERNGGLGDVELPQAGAEPQGRAPDSVAGIAARALPSVVTLHVRGTDAAGTGTGFVLDAQGHILTNNHVVEPAGTGGQISVTFSGGETAKATVVGHDSGYDLAVVKVSGVGGLKPMPLGNSDNVRVGDPVVAIGAPFDLANTVTSGIISAKERPITAGGEGGSGSDVSYVDALQTDAPINPGNSGGPLLDSKARVIGINSAIRSADSGSATDGGQAGSIGLGFAIPVNQAKRVAEELINTGKATHPVIGVTLDMDYTGDGARVGVKGNDGGSAVIAGGPGDKAGIESGDVITELDGRPVHSGEELIVKTRAHRPGDRLELTLTRGGAQKKVTLVLGSADSN